LVSKQKKGTFLGKTKDEYLKYELSFDNESIFKDLTKEIEKIGFKLSKNKWTLMLD
jgi:hypothetical protein